MATSLPIINLSKVELLLPWSASKTTLAIMATSVYAGLQLVPVPGPLAKAWPVMILPCSAHGTAVPQLLPTVTETLTAPHTHALMHRLFRNVHSVLLFFTQLSLQFLSATAHCSEVPRYSLAKTNKLQHPQLETSAFASSSFPCRIFSVASS
eukprot:scpid70424/ scgid6779/ 